MGYIPPVTSELRTRGKEGLKTMTAYSLTGSAFALTSV
jgi:hypothetical protein